MPASLNDYMQKRLDLASMDTAPPMPAATRAGRAGGTNRAPAAGSAAAPTAPTAAAQARQQLNQEINQLERQSFLNYVQSWLAFAAKPENSAQENLVMFLSNVLVVGQSKVRDPTRLYAHTDLLRNAWQQSYPYMMKLVTFSPAMIQYLDLNTNERNGPNENYAREVMELFTLGEGHYSEGDIKEAARAEREQFHHFARVIFIGRCARSCSGPDIDHGRRKGPPISSYTDTIAARRCAAHRCVRKAASDASPCFVRPRARCSKT